MTNHNKVEKDISYPDTGNDLCFEVEDKSFWFRHRNDCILELLKQFPPGSVFFDIGGGNGYVAKALEDNGFRTTLVQPGKAGINNAIKRGLKNVINSRLEDLDIPSHSLSAIGLFDVLEHIKNPNAFLEIISRFLTTDGRLYISLPAFNFLWSYEDVFAGHFTRFSLKTSKKMLIENGYTIEYATYIFSFLPFLIFLSRTFPYWLGVGKKEIGKKNNKILNDHTELKKNGILNKLIHSIFQKELKFIHKKKKMPIGSTCLLIARKNAVSITGKTQC